MRFWAESQEAGPPTELFHCGRSVSAVALDIRSSYRSKPTCAGPVSGLPGAVIVPARRPELEVELLVIKEETTLRALLRAIVSAKFSTNPLDRDVPASPVVAALAREAAATLEGRETVREGASAEARWKVWRAFSPERLEWEAALTYATDAFAGHWPHWNEEQREQALRDLISPYELNPTTREQFLRELKARLEC